ncbi:phage baseplate assembly protein V [Tatumella sp. OPLPL6]|uniref:phage baseplate assembly protein V n=1 Tax=Tatumella sp. OPLPL6 TaxID=1928657 RepID=UPI000C1A7E21|nr:phage baseplate assembly protein V [Tatumella sp. OPLPL6]PIJ42626.1 baseplate assembly protein [Tatumella sp. OPLPL6]
MNTQLNELLRLITNLIRTGIISEVDPDNWLCRVKVGELETNWINWLTFRAGKTRSWWCPSVGEQVVLLSLGGNLDTAFALPAIYSNQFPPPSNSLTAEVTEFEDGALFSYDPASGQLKVTGIKSLLVEASESLTYKTPQLHIEAEQTRINSDVVINGTVTQGGGVMSSNGIVVDKHHHEQVKKGTDLSGEPV